MHLEGHFDEQRSQWVTTIRVTESPPNALGPIIGDIAHNTRSTLDQLTWQLALLKTAAPYRRTRLPDLGRPRRLRRARKPPAAEPGSCPRGVHRRLQPYQDEEPTWSLLHGLNVLSNVDKHREMHFANSALMEASLTIRMTGGGVGFGRIEPVFGQFTDGSVVARLHDVHAGADGEPPRFEVDIQAAFDLGVTDDDGIGSRSGPARSQRESSSETSSTGSARCSDSSVAQLRTGFRTRAT